MTLRLRSPSGDFNPSKLFHRSIPPKSAPPNTICSRSLVAGYKGSEIYHSSMT